MKREILFGIAPGLVAMAVASAPAFAQKVGTYNGTMTDGNSISFTVATDSNTGSLELTGAGFGFTGTCKPGGGTEDFYEGIGFGQDFSGAKATVTFGFSNYYVLADLKFAGDRVSGTVVQYASAFAPYTKTPKKGAVCADAKQDFTATLASGDAAPPKAVKGGVYEYHEVPPAQ